MRRRSGHCRHRCAGRPGGVRQNAKGTAMAVKPKFKVTVDEPKWLRMIRAKEQPVAVAAEAALRDVAADAVQEGRADIAAAGPGFRHAEWLSGLQYRVSGDRVGGLATLSGK